MKNTTDAADWIKRFVATSFDFFAREQWRLDLLFDLWSTGLRHRAPAQTLTGAGGKYRELVSRIETVIQQGIGQGIFRTVDTRSAASALLAMMDGLLIQAAMRVITLDSNSTAKRVCHIFLDGICR